MPRPGLAPDLTGGDRRLFLRVRRALLAQGTFDDEKDVELLTHYVRAVALARKARAEATTDPWIEGSRGQLVAHPALRIAREATRDAQDAAKALILTPAARRRAGLDDATADDDALASILAD